MLDDSDAPSLTLLAPWLNAKLSDISDCYLPDAGPFARQYYPKHCQFVSDTADNSVCSAFGGNRVGKSMLLAFCDAVFATGRYPAWWTGRRFAKPVRIWIAGQDSDLVIASKQKYLIGVAGEGGLIPKSHIKKINWSSHIKGFAESVEVLHEPTGYTSLVIFKTYREGWQAFQSDTIDVADLDEECAAKIYSECVTRTMTTDGLVMIGFTALQGVTPLVAHLLPQYAGWDTDEIGEEEKPIKRSHVFIGWDDVPYSQLPEAKRKEMRSHYLPHEILARTKGIPTIGQGLVYPVAESEFVVEPFDLPDHWPRLFTVDPGGTERGDGKMAALWCIHDIDADVVYAYTEYYSHFKAPELHALEFKRRGSWIPCEMDPAGASITDGKAVLNEFRKAMHDVNPNWSIQPADKQFAVGRLELFNRMTTGGFKVFNTCRNLLHEHRQYIRNDNGVFIGTHHLLDCARYAVRRIGRAKLKKEVDHELKNPAKIRETTFGFWGNR